MAIENRELTAGTRLVARYRGKEHTCEVVRSKDGLRYRLKDGKEFNSPSSAGMQITSGIAVNGWRFWSVKGDLKARPAKGERSTKSPTKKSAKSKGKKTAQKKVARATATGDSYGCGACGQTFPTMKKATTHALTHTTA
jgi:hypothetical protein